MMHRLKHNCALAWAHTRPMTTGESYGTIVREVFGKTPAWATERSHQGFTQPRIKEHLARP